MKECRWGPAGMDAALLRALQPCPRQGRPVPEPTPLAPSLAEWRGLTVTHLAVGGWQGEEAGS